MKDKIHRQTVLLVASGLIGASLVCVITFTTVAVLDYRLLVATFCFAVAIPTLAASILLVTDESFAVPIREPNSYLGLLLVGIFSAIIGIGAMFFHLNIWAGLTFSIAIVAALAVSMAIRPE